MWYFKYFPNEIDLAKNAMDPTKTKHDRRNLQAWPFVGISLDLSLKDLLNGISDVFTGTPRAFQPPTQIITSN
ncbi:hypothetical protein DR864_28470 (plasmid) [Runella rosea]|uniref:Uncharacterized protein n=1 Tax=Runella rosea TaxID=2259595 RepID=A0A344TT39_9BACT|nr:hypothetical protein DR864_28470 [Runella rosea]